MPSTFVIDFLKGYALGAVMLVVLGTILAAIGGPEVSSGTSAALLVAGAFFAASRHVAAGGTAIAGTQAWRLALHCTLAALLLSIPLMLLAALAGVEGMAEIVSVLGIGGLVAVLVLSLVISLLVLRLTIPWAVRLSLRQHEKATRGGR